MQLWELPWALPLAFAGLIFAWFFHTEYGVVNDVVRRVAGPAEPTMWLLRPNWAFTAICMRHKTALRTVLEGGRTAHVTAARHEMWAHARAAGLTYPAIGALTGSDHTSVLNALRAAQVRAERNRVRCAAARRIA